MNVEGDVKYYLKETRYEYKKKAEKKKEKEIHWSAAYEEVKKTQDNDVHDDQKCKNIITLNTIRYKHIEEFAKIESNLNMRFASSFLTISIIFISNVILFLLL